MEVPVSPSERKQRLMDDMYRAMYVIGDGMTYFESRKRSMELRFSNLDQRDFREGFSGLKNEYINLMGEIANFQAETRLHEKVFESAESEFHGATDIVELKNKFGEDVCLLREIFDGIYKLGFNEWRLEVIGEFRK